MMSFKDSPFSKVHFKCRNSILTKTCLSNEHFPINSEKCMFIYKVLRKIEIHSSLDVKKTDFHVNNE